MVNEVLSIVCTESDFPSMWEGQLVDHGTTRVLPLSGLALVVGKVDTTIRQHSSFYCEKLTLILKALSTHTHRVVTIQPVDL